MLSRVITLRFNELVDGLDDNPLREFIKDKEVISIREYFFSHLDRPYLAIMVNYKLKPIATEAAVQSQGRESRRRSETWREYVSESDIPLFNSLRDWRIERGKQDGVPPYVIFTNQELGAIASAKPSTLGQLGQIAGVGVGKIKAYGADLLVILGRYTPRQESSEDTLTKEGTDESGKG